MGAEMRRVCLALIAGALLLPAPEGQRSSLGAPNDG